MSSAADRAREKKYEEQEKKWRADSDLRTLIEAEKIKQDKPRYAEAMKLHKEMSASLAEIEKDAKK